MLRDDSRTSIVEEGKLKTGIKAANKEAWIPIYFKGDGKLHRHRKSRSGFGSGGVGMGGSSVGNLQPSTNFTFMNTKLPMNLLASTDPRPSW